MILSTLPGGFRGRTGWGKECNYNVNSIGSVLPLCGVVPNSWMVCVVGEP